MFVLANFISAVAHILDAILNILSWLIFIRALISGVNPDPHNPIVQFLEKATEPLLSPIRKILPWRLRFGIDIAPIIAFFAIMFLRQFLVRTLVDIALKLR